MSRFYVVSLVDVNELLSFSSSRTLDDFFNVFKKFYSRAVHHVGGEARAGKPLEFYLVSRGGFIYVMPETPLHLSAFFVKRKDAVEFASALKLALKSFIPPTPVRELLVNSVSVSERDEALYSKASGLKGRLVYKPLILVFTALNLILLFGFLNVAFHALAGLLGVSSWAGWFVDPFAVLAALVVAFLFTIVYGWVTSLAFKMLP